MQIQRISALAFAGVTLASLASSQTIQSWSGDFPGDRLGWSVASVPDVDLDGHDEVLLGVPFAPIFSVQVGTAQLFSTSGGFLNEYTGEAALDHAGWSVAGLGDLDGDGRGEVAIGLPDSSDAYSRGGMVLVLSGLTGTELLRWTGSAVDEAFGYSVANAGDIDGDGFDDVIVGAWKAGAAAGRVEVRSTSNGQVLHTHVGAAAGDRFGLAVAGLGDVDGDDRDDYAVGAPQSASSGGYVQVRSGLTGLLLRTHVGQNLGEELGAAISRLGDLDGDNRNEYAIGSPLAPAGGSSRGQVRLFDGSSGLELWTQSGQADGDLFGSALDGGHDLDADLLPDLLVGAPFGAGGRGTAQVLSGANGVSLRNWSGVAGGDRFGAALAFIDDLDGDNVADVIVGAPREDAGATDAGGAHAFSGAASCGPVLHCTAKVNSIGCLPVVQWSGSPTLTGPDDFVVRGLDVLGLAVGTMIYSANGPAATPSLGGTLCLQTPFFRSAPIQAGGDSEFDCSGELLFDFTQAFMQQNGWAAGDRIDVQFWSRDHMNPDGTGSSLTNALGIVLCP